MSRRFSRVDGKRHIAAAVSLLNRLSPRLRTWLAGCDPLLVASAALFLLFPRGFLPWVGLGLLLAGFVVRRVTAGRWIVRTALDRPIAIILLATLASLYPSVDLNLSAPKFFGLLFGFCIYFSTVSSISKERHFWVGVGLLIASVVGISLLGLVGTQWNISKYPWLAQVYRGLPRMIGTVQTSVGPALGIHPNELGGTVAFLLPLPLALMLRAPLSLLHRGILAATIFLGLAVLALTGSRSAFLSSAAAFSLLLTWRWRLVGVGLLLMSVTSMVVAISHYPSSMLLEFFLQIDASTVSPGSSSLPSRLEIWDRAGTMIGDFPFTGIGLNTFPIMLDRFYPTFLAGVNARLPHAHNIFLQTAIDLGLGGLLGFLGLWASAAYGGWQAYRRARKAQRWKPSPVNPQPENLTGRQSGAALMRLFPGASMAGQEKKHLPHMEAAIVGMVMGMFSYLFYGLTDAITLGAKPMVLLWLMLGLIVAAGRLTQRWEAAPSSGLGISTFEPRAKSWFFLTEVVPVFKAAAQRVYWIIAYVLVGLGYLVLGMAIVGRMS